MTTEISEEEAILTLSLVIADMASMMDNNVLNNNITNVTNELVCNASIKPLTKDFYITLNSLVHILRQNINR
ncbi:hypothetical protein [Desulforamulus aquiferis]|nr:hypothetical protein [Desulforamulus aquiferis]